MLSSWLSTAGMIVLALLVNVSAVRAQTSHLLDAEPFDVIVLNEQNQGKVLRVLPLNLPDRKLPANTRPTDRLRVRLVSNPEEQIDVSWSGIARVQLFEQMLLAEARRLMKQRKFDEAFEYLTRIHDRYPDTDGLVETVDQLLYAEASSLYQQGSYERALLLLDEIYQRTPGRRGLIGALRRVLNRSFESHLRNRDFQQSRRLYELAQTKYATAVPRLIQQWRQRLESIGVKALERMRSDVKAGRMREAYLAGRRVLEIWPDTPGAAELVASVSLRYPLLRVGVQQPPPSPLNPSPLTRLNWAARRTERLRMRHLFELHGVGPDGGQYACSVGSLQSGESTRSLTLRVDAEGTSRLTGVHVARLLLMLGDPDDSLFDPAWAALVDRVGATDLNTVEALFRRPHLRAAALLNVPLDELRSEELRRAWQPYLLNDSNSESTETRYLVNPSYAKLSATQPREVVEQHYETPRQAVRALRRGEVDLIDRVFPSDVTLMRRDPKFVVTSYRIPTVHVLVPNHQRLHTGNRLFRRGLLYAIDRESILKRDLLGGAKISGCQVVSGPFSPGVSSDDPVAYGYDTQIEARAYDPRHARTLLQLAQIELAAVAEKSKSTLPQLSQLVLVHPAHEIARIACSEIVEDLKVIGVTCTLRELDGGHSRPSDDQWDLLYLDYVIPEPLVDAAPLLASQGFVGSPSPHLNLALRQLERVDNWNRAGERLRVIHQLCFDDTTILPLWQIVDHLVHRKGIQGISSEPVATYQDIETWRLTSE